MFKLRDHSFVCNPRLIQMHDPMAWLEKPAPNVLTQQLSFKKGRPNSDSPLMSCGCHLQLGVSIPLCNCQSLLPGKLLLIGFCIFSASMHENSQRTKLILLCRYTKFCLPVRLLGQLLPYRSVKPYYAITGVTLPSIELANVFVGFCWLLTGVLKIHSILKQNI